MSVGRLPLTARSSSSHETPRTGGGFTARSSGEKGTPRDAQRLALGERPRDEAPQPRPEGWPGAAPPGASPQHTARSAGLSSEPRSMTPSSQGDSLSSRSRLDATCVGAAEEVALAAAAAHVAVPWQHGPQAAAPAAEAGAAAAQGAQQGPSLLELQKSLEITRIVIVKENQKLQELAQRSRDALTELKGEVESAEMGEARPVREPLQVEWFVRNIDEAIAGGPWGLQEHEEFRAPEFPEAVFRLELRAAPEAVDAAEMPVSLELCLEVSGWGALGLELRAGMLVETEEEAADAECQARLSSGGLAKIGLRHGEPVVVRRPWPSGACTAVCRAEVERAWPSVGEPLELQTSCWGQWN